jgi:hypothetical protein
VLQIAHLRKRFRPDHRPDRHRIGRVEHLTRFVRRQEGIDLLLRRDIDTLVGVGKDETVHAHHHRQAQLLGQLEGLDVQIERFLVGLGKKLEPATVALRDRIRMIVPDVDRRADRPVGHRHHDRQTETGRVVNRFDHEQQTLRRGGGVGSRTGGRGTDRHTHGREFGFNVDEFAILHLARLDHLADAFDDVRLRGNRIGADHFRPAQRDRLGNGVRALDLLKHWQPPC